MSQDLRRDASVRQAGVSAWAVCSDCEGAETRCVCDTPLCKNN